MIDEDEIYNDDLRSNIGCIAMSFIAFCIIISLGFVVFNAVVCLFRLIF